MKHYLELNSGDSQALIIRHGEREPITTSDTVWHAKLTGQGKLDAVEFGKTLHPLKPAALYSSPIPRCIDTASSIVKGCNVELFEIVPERMLLEAYIKDGKLAETQFKTRDPYELILDQLERKDIPGFYTVEEGSVRLLNYIKKVMVKGKLTIFVTHDAILMPFKAHFLNRKYNKEDWFPFLGNASVRIDKDGNTFINNTPIS
ncbi:MAG: histidine phosphatase family protein [Deltaproteobacteria bacterium]|nr:histidine phosphatase family protein [Deltaproteobacteria bacterium]